MIPVPTRPLRRTFIRLTAMLLAILAFGGAATAAQAAPVWTIDLHHNQTNFPPGGTGEYWVDLNNAGSDPSAGLTTVRVNLPSGLTRAEVRDVIGNENATWSCPGSPGASSIVCTTSDSIPRHSRERDLVVVVNVAPTATGDKFASATVVGGGAALSPPAAGCAPGVSACAVELTHIDPSPAVFGIVAGSWQPGFFESDRVTPVRQAGSHPDLAVFPVDFNTISSPCCGDPDRQIPVENTRSLRVDLPQGFIGDPTSVDECTPSQLTTGTCPPSSQVGRLDGHVYSTAASHFTSFTSGIFNMEHPLGTVADLGFTVFNAPVHIRASLDPARNYAVTTTISNLTEALPAYDGTITIWGVPSDPAHDWERCQEFSADKPGDTSKSCASSGPTKPFVTVPSECGIDKSIDLRNHDSWDNPGVFSPDVEHTLPGHFTGCEQAQAEFDPTVSISPTSNKAGSPTGLNITASSPQNLDPEGIGTPPVKSFEIRFPEGVSVNPSFADGLRGCTEAEIGISHAGVPNGDPVTCPDASRIGAVTLSTPLLPKPLEGSIYLAQQEANPYNSLLALYFVVHDVEDRNILVKIPGRLDLDPKTGQIVSSFDQLPQFPFDALSVQFRGGDRAPLINPPTCGTKTVEASLATWTEPGTKLGVDSFYDVAQGSNGAPCAGTRGALPFSPLLKAGSTDPLAGSFAPFVLRLTRGDGEQELTGLAVDLPQGLVGKLAGVATCSDATLASIPDRPGTAAAEKANPSCPVGSRVGRVNVGSGAGPLPFYISGAAYLAGPYRGAPQSVAVVTPVLAGGVDLGNVVVRTALHIDPTDSHVRAVSDPLPTILHGVPTHIREVRVILDRNQFTLNPTDCSEAAINGQAGGAGTSLVGQEDDSVAPLSDRFQVSGCERLGFKPRLTFRLRGGTNRGDHPALFSRLTARPGDANIRRAVVALPHSLFLENAHIRTICTRVQFAAEACPAGSVYGYARAVTPLLDQPVEGPVVLRSSDNPLPDLVAKLRGQISADLVGRIDSVNEGIRTTFSTVPDVPVTEFTISFKGKKKGLLVNSRNLCKAPSRVNVGFVAQNDRRRYLRPALRTTGCKKGQPKRKGKSGRG